jgi:flagellar protein FlgJ
MSGVRTPADAANALALDANALAGLRRQAREAPDKALSKAAGQFEALFLNMVLKQMRESLPKDGPLDSDSIRTYTAMFDQQVAQQLSARGIGLRQALERQLARHVNGTPSPGEARDPPRPVTMKVDVRPATHAPAAASEAPARSVAANVQAFVDKLRPHAEAAAKALGVPAHLLIAQAGLETGWGRSQPRNTDGSASHNLFGIKAGSSWRGGSVAAATTEFVHGAAVRTVEKFRSYGSYTDAFRDLARLLSTRRYSEAVANAADPAAYAKSLQRAGYATDPAYADKLTQAIRMVSRQLAATPPTDGIRVAHARAPQEAPAAADIPNDGRA